MAEIEKCRDEDRGHAGRQSEKFRRHCGPPFGRAALGTAPIKKPLSGAKPPRAGLQATDCAGFAAWPPAGQILDLANTRPKPQSVRPDAVFRCPPFGWLCRRVHRLLEIRLEDFNGRRIR
jgi:hypothetical protein